VIVAAVWDIATISGQPPGWRTALAEQGPYARGKPFDAFVVGAQVHQYLVLEPLTPSTRKIDGVALLGSPTRVEFETRFFDSDAGRAEIMADAARFMDRPGPETTLVGPPTAPVLPG
jgi:hypothetical protein